MAPPVLKVAMKRVEQTKDETMREQRGLTLHGAGNPAITAGSR
jgi:hypothetical protein